VGDGGPGDSAGNIVTALSAVAGVADAEIAPDGRPGGAGTLRLTLEPGSDEVAVAAAVNWVLREQFGLVVDADRVAIVEESPERRLRRSAVSAPAASHRRGSPAAETLTTSEPHGGVEEEDEGPSADDEMVIREITMPSARGSRLLIERLQLTSADLTVDAEVTLGRHGETYVGRSHAGATATSIHRAVAQATLRAVEVCIGHEARFEVEHLEVPAMGSERAVLVDVSMITRRGAERFTGVSTVRDDVRAAVVRATLAALNRRLESFAIPV
jgi:hypothetical protein